VSALRRRTLGQIFMPFRCFGRSGRGVSSFRAWIQLEMRTYCNTVHQAIASCTVSCSSSWRPLVRILYLNHDNKYSSPCIHSDQSWDADLPHSSGDDHNAKILYSPRRCRSEQTVSEKGCALLLLYMVWNS
jgi:hypothetical protein